MSQHPGEPLLPEPQPDEAELETLFARVLELPPTDQQGFLDSECVNRPFMRARIQKLLDADAVAGRFMEGAPETDSTAGSAQTSAKLGSIGRYPFTSDRSMLRWRGSVDCRNHRLKSQTPTRKSQSNPR